MRLRFFAALAQKDNFVLEATTNWEDLNDANVKQYQLVVWLNEFPHNQAERDAFEKYMTGGGCVAWLSRIRLQRQAHPVAVVHDVHRRRRV